MADDTESSVSSGLSAAERSLLREVFRWARANGWQRDNLWDDEISQSYMMFWRWQGKALEDEVFLEKDTKRGEVGCWRFVARTVEPDIELGCDLHLDVRKAVDVLVALGVLPNHFSSAYNAAHADGMAALKEVVVSTAVERELEQRFDRLSDSLEDMTAAMAHLLAAESTYDKRQAMRTILAEIAEVVDADA